MLSPSLMDSYSLEVADFEGEKFHELIFSTIYNLYSQGANRIDSFSVDSYLSRYEKQYKMFEENQGLDYCENAQELADLSNFSYYYQRLRKFSYLRELNRRGFDTKLIYDDTVTDPELQEKEMERLDAFSILDISEYVIGSMTEASSKFISNAETRGQLAGKGMRELKEELKKEPEIGIPMQSQMLTTIVRGARLKKFFLRSGNTGSGKCVVGSTLIPTNKGLIPIKDIPKYFPVSGNRCNAQIISYDISTGEQKTMKTSHWYDMGVSETVKIITSQGYEIEGTPEHPIVVETDNGMEFRRLDEIKLTDKAAICSHNPFVEGKGKDTYFFDQIIDISNGYERVYDFTVPETHCFVANGFISHNTRTALGDICTYSIPWYYDTDEKKWVYTGFSCPSAFISTELDEQEMQTLVMAYVSGVNEEHICDGKYVGDDADEEARVDQAITYIESSPLYIVIMEDFDLDDLERVIRHYQREHGVQYFAFDYIQNTVKMMTSLNTKTRGRLREDQLLLIMSTQIKMLCNKLNVHIDSFTQVNGEYANVKEKNQNIIAGGKAIANKIDVGVISLAPSKIELETVKKKVLSHKINCPEPNLIYHIYKVRKGKLNRIMLWLKADLGTCRTKDLFVTDLDFNEIPLELITVENIDKVLDETSIDVDDIDVTEEEQQEAIKSWGSW